MGGKSSKGKGDPTTLQIQQHDQLQKQVDADLASKRPQSRRILDQWGVSQSPLPAYALETLDEENALIVKRPTSDVGDDLEANNNEIAKRKSTAEDSDDGEALVYVFNPERVVSHRVSKRISTLDENLLMERWSRQSSESQLRPPSTNAGTPKNGKLDHFTMANIGSVPQDYQPFLKLVDCSVIGRTGSTQDDTARHLCQDEAHFEFTRCGSEDVLCFGIFDGHGQDGHLIARLCAKEMTSCLVDDQQFYLNSGDYTEAMKSGMKSFQQRLDEIPPNRADTERSGTTATIGLYSTKQKKLYIANCGDSRCVGARKQGGDSRYAVVKLSDEHIFTVQSEIDRVTNAGGRVSPIIIDGRPIGPPRCWFGFEESDEPGLMVSRALGDSIARRIGVNCEVTQVYSNSVEDGSLAFVIVASDGLWEVMTNEEAIGFVGGTIHAAAKSTSPLAISEMLCLEAKRRWFQLEQKCGDDISAMVISFV